jgi:hypothetical protein
MHDLPDHELIARLLQALPSAADARAGALADARRRLDRRNPVGAGWLRRWWPLLMVVEAPRCSCTAGRCVVCN